MWATQAQSTEPLVSFLWSYSWLAFWLFTPFFSVLPNLKNTFNCLSVGCLSDSLLLILLFLPVSRTPSIVFLTHYSLFYCSSQSLEHLLLSYCWLPFWLFTPFFSVLPNLKNTFNCLSIGWLFDCLLLTTTPFQSLKYLSFPFYIQYIL
jgi:hypothetical protein